MRKLSANKDINKMCDKILGTRRWKVKRHEKHIILRHFQGKILIVPTTPGDCKAFANFESCYKRNTQNQVKCVTWF